MGSKFQNVARAKVLIMKNGVDKKDPNEVKVVIPYYNNQKIPIVDEEDVENEN